MKALCNSLLLLAFLIPVLDHFGLWQKWEYAPKAGQIDEYGQRVVRQAKHIDTGGLTEAEQRKLNAVIDASLTRQEYKRSLSKTPAEAKIGIADLWGTPKDYAWAEKLIKKDKP